MNTLPLAQDRGSGRSCSDVPSLRLLLFQGLSRTLGTLWSEAGSQVTDPPWSPASLAGLRDAQGSVHEDIWQSFSSSVALAGMS